MLSKQTTESATAVHMPPITTSQQVLHLAESITTSQQVLHLAESKRTDAKLKKVVKAWGLEYIDVYKQWYPLGCSRDFLIQLVELSRLVEYTQGQQILADCREARLKEAWTSAGGWIILDAKLAVSRAKELHAAHHSESTPRPRRTASMARGSQKSASESHGDTPAKGMRKRTRQRSNSGEVFEMRTSEANVVVDHTLARSTEDGDTANALARSHSDVAGALVDCFKTRVSRKATAVRTPSAVARHFPPTPVSTTSAHPGPRSVTLTALSEPMSCTSEPRPVIEQELSPVSNVDDQQAAEVSPITHSDRGHSSSGVEPAVEPRQPVLRGSAQAEWTDDDCTDVLLQMFNPDPSIWYIVPTQMLETGRAAVAALPEIRDVESLPKMVLIPMRGADEAQRTLIFFDRMRAHCIVFDAGGCDKVAQMAWSTAQTFLTRTGILRGEASVDLDPFPLVRLNEGVSCGVFLIIVALHKFHDKKIDRVSPRLWRGLLGAFFVEDCDTSQERLKRLLSEFTRPTYSEANEGIGLERNVEDAEYLNLAKTTVQSYVDEARLLCEITEAQLQSVQQKRQLAKVHEWLLAKPPDTGPFWSEFAALETKKIVDQLRGLPEIPEWCEQRLRVVKTCCQHAVVKCEQAVLMLEARRKDVVGTADTKYKLLGVRLASLRPDISLTQDHCGDCA